MQKIIDFYRYAITEMEKTKVYFGHGTTDAVSEAWWLVAGALHLPLDVIKTDFLHATLTPEECTLLHDLIHKRTIERIPTAYLLHEAYQNGYKFYIDERVLIPRSPIAAVIEQQFSPWIQKNQVNRILDLCTGSGCLAILAAHTFPDAIIDAADISIDALQVAAQNIDLHAVGERVNLIQSDVFQTFYDEKYDVIISNPPYVDAEDFADMPTEYSYEPALALSSGQDGLNIVKRILANAKKYLNSNGILIVEVGNSSHALIEAYPDLPLHWLELERHAGGVFLVNAKDL